MADPKNERIAVMEVLFAGCAWGSSGLFTRYLTGLGMSPVAVAFFRCLSAALMLAVFLALRDRSVFRVRGRDLWMFVGTGAISIGLFSAFYFLAQTLTTLSLAAVLLYTAPFFVIFMSRLFFKEPITRQKIVALILAFAGCLFATGVIGGGAIELSLAAVMAGLASGVCYALYSIFGEVALRRYQPMTVTVYSLAFAAASLGLIFAASGAAMPQVSGGMILAILGMGLIPTAIPYIFYTRGLAGLSPSKASVLAFAEPMMATVLGIVVLHEPMTLTSLAGIALIFAGIVVLNRRSQ